MDIVKLISTELEKCCTTFHCMIKILAADELSLKTHHGTNILFTIRSSE